MNLDELEGRIRESVDLINVRLTGRVRPEHRLGYHNFISCVFEGVIAEGVDLSGCDFKDTLVVDSQFADCKINAATHTASVYTRSAFKDCNFHNAAVTDCEYTDVQFISCDLDNVLIKNSRFYECKFARCATSTHVFENNLFTKCNFQDTEVEIRTLVSNFGLKATSMSGTRIRDNRVSEPHRYLVAAELLSVASTIRNDPLATLAMRYFIDGDLLGANDNLDAAFSLGSWATMARQPTSFAQLVELFAEFLVTAYEHDEVDIHKLLLVHDVTRRIVYDFSLDARTHRFAVSFGGIHLALSRIVEEYLATLWGLYRNGSGPLRVIAEGPPSLPYHEEALAEFLEWSGMRIAAVQPYNSVLLTLVEQVADAKLVATALILASMVRFQLKAVHNASHPFRVPTEALPDSSTSVAVAQPAEPFEFFEISAGLTEDARRAYEFRVKSLIPTTSIIVDLRLTVSTSFMRKLRNAIVSVAKET